MKYLLIFAVFISELICNPLTEIKKSQKIKHMFYIVCITKRVSVKDYCVFLWGVHWVWLF